MTRLGAYNPVSDTWEPFRGATVVPPSGSDRLGLFVTEAELDVWRTRSVSGPYKVQGDVTSNSPGDWSRIVSWRDYFDANSLPIVTLTDPLQRGNMDIPHHTSNDHVSRVMCAAFHALITQDTAMGAKVINWLVEQATTPEMDFSDSSKFSSSAHPDEVFRVGEYLGALVQTYDFVRVLGSTSSSQRATMTKWFVDAMAWAVPVMYNDVNSQGFWTDRYTLDVNDSSDLGHNGTKTHSQGWLSTRQTRRYNNRKTCTFALAVLGGLLFDQPLRVQQGKQLWKEWLAMGYWPDRDYGEMYRGDPSMTSNPEIGWSYTGQILGDLFLSMEALARAGDTSLHTFTTRAGTPTEDGSACKTGDPDKNMLDVALGWAYYGNDVHNRYQGSSTLDNRIDGRNPRSGSSWRGHREIMLAMPNKYYNHPHLNNGYLRLTSAGYPGYWSSPSSRITDEMGGRIGLPGVLFMFGGLESLHVYPGS